MAKTKTDKSPSLEGSTLSQVESILGEKKYKDLTNYGARGGEDTVKPVDLISTGSFFFDYVLGGGFRGSSWCRMYGDPETGKSSMALKWGRNWQDFYGKKGVVVYFNAEGRIRKEHINGSGLHTDERFIIVDANISDLIYSVIEDLVHNNPNDNKYFFIVDSTDACQRAQDLGKGIQEAEKIGGSATVLSAAGKRLSLLFDRTGHVLYMCSQVRDKINTYSPGGGAPKGASGGNAPQFYSSLTGKIKKPWSNTKIFEDPSDSKSKVIGHLVEIVLEKTPNKTTGTTVTFPVKYDIEGGVWRAYEAFMVAETWGFLDKKGAHYYWTEDMKALFASKGWNDIPDSFFGEKKLRNYFDTRPDMVEAIFEKVKQVI